MVYGRAGNTRLLMPYLQIRLGLLSAMHCESLLFSLARSGMISERNEGRVLNRSEIFSGFGTVSQPSNMPSFCQLPFSSTDSLNAEPNKDSLLVSNRGPPATWTQASDLTRVREASVIPKGAIRTTMIYPIDLVLCARMVMLLCSESDATCSSPTSSLRNHT